jgi:predicted dehydrogenase
LSSLGESRLFSRLPHIGNKENAMAGFRFVLLGAGFFARKWLEVIATRADVEVVGIATRSSERAAELKRDFRLPHAVVYPEWETAVGMRGADGALITIPQMLHPQATVLALRAGLHVLVEKPLSVDIAGARTVYDEAMRYPAQVVMVNQNYRWRPHVQAFRRAVQEGRIGRVGHMTIEVRQQIRRKTTDAWREAMPEPFLLDFAIHHFDLIRYLTGEDGVRVVGQSFRPSWSWYDGNAAAGAIVTLRSGAVVQYAGTMVSLGLETPQEGLVTAIGEQGTLHLDGESRVRLFGQGDPKVLPQEPIPVGELGYSLDEFLGAVREKRRPATCVVEHIKSLALAFATLESSRRGQAVMVEELLDFLPT